MWCTDSRGVPRGDGGLALSTLDAARLGELYLRRGVLGGRRIVSERHVAAATTPVTGGGPPEEVAYGLMWWIEPDAGPPAFFAGGHAGQLVAVVPDLELVCVLTGEEDALRAGATSGRPVLRSHVIPACTG